MRNPLGLVYHWLCGAIEMSVYIRACTILTFQTKSGSQVESLIMLLNSKIISWVSYITTKRRADYYNNQSQVYIMYVAELETTRGPMGHILDTAIRCFRAMRVQLPNKSKFAKLKPSLEKYLQYLIEHFLVIMMRVQYNSFYSS